MIRTLGIVRFARTAAAAGLALLLAAAAAPAPVSAADTLIVGYLHLKKDPRYTKKQTYARYLGQPLGRPYRGAAVALEESKFHGAAAGVEFDLKSKRVKSQAGLLKALDKMSAAGTQLFLVDVPGDMLVELAAATAGRDILLFNITAQDDRLRSEICHPHVLHVIPSRAMYADALAQYLVSRKWREVLSLVGPSPADQAMAAAFERAAKRFGLEIVDRREFVLGTDPRQRDQNNVALLTASADYDVVHVADTDGEFARQTPFQTLSPRPVVGSEGLAAMAWHWSWERHGAPQLEGRFEKKAKRPMTGIDWAAWMAFKAIADAVQRTESADFANVREYLLSPDLILDGFKGNRVNFRPWSNQMRQPVLLATHNWVIERAPIEGFLHQKNNLDSIGYDERDVQCEMPGR